MLLELSTLGRPSFDSSLSNTTQRNRVRHTSCPEAWVEFNTPRCIREHAPFIPNRGAR